MTIDLATSTSPEVSVVIIATREGPRLARCLEAVAASLDGPPAQVLLVLNAADADVLAVANQVRGAIVMPLSADLGTAGAWNRAVETTETRRFVTLHEDARPHPGWLATLSSTMDADPSIAVAGARLLNTDGTLQNRGWITWDDGRSWPIRESTLGRVPSEGLLAVDLVSSATAMVDRQLWQDMNGFDERFFPAVGVDVDLGWSAWARNRTVVSVLAATATHDTGAMVSKGVGAASSELQRRYLINRSEHLIASKWCDLLTHGPEPDVDGHAMAQRALTEVAERRPSGEQRRDVPRSDRWLTGAEGDREGTWPEIEARANTRRAQIQQEVSSWAIETHDELQRCLFEIRAEAARRADIEPAPSGVVDLLEAEAEKLRTELAAMSTALAEAHAQTAAASREAEARGDVVARLRSEVEQVVTTARLLEQELCETQERLTAVATELEAVRATRTWRLHDAITRWVPSPVGARGRPTGRRRA